VHMLRGCRCAHSCTCAIWRGGSIECNGIHCGKSRLSVCVHAKRSTDLLELLPTGTFGKHRLMFVVSHSLGFQKPVRRCRSTKAPMVEFNRGDQEAQCGAD
jgi:hypothetical protein